MHVLISVTQQLMLIMINSPGCAAIVLYPCNNARFKFSDVSLIIDDPDKFTVFFHVEMAR